MTYVQRKNRLKVYLDACCLSRTTDDQSQARAAAKLRQSSASFPRFARAWWTWFPARRLRMRPGAIHPWNGVLRWKRFCLWLPSTVELDDAVAQRARVLRVAATACSMRFTWRRPRLRARTCRCPPMTVLI